METSEDAGLTVTYDDETGVIHLDWDPEKNPEYNYLEDLTSEEFSDLLLAHLRKLQNGESAAREIPTGRQSCGTTESDCNSGVES